MSEMGSDQKILADLKSEYQYGWSQPENYVFKGETLD